MLEEDLCQYAQRKASVLWIIFCVNLWSSELLLLHLCLFCWISAHLVIGSTDTKRALHTICKEEGHEDKHTRLCNECLYNIQVNILTNSMMKTLRTYFSLSELRQIFLRFSEVFNLEICWSTLVIYHVWQSWGQEWWKCSDGKISALLEKKWKEAQT